MASEIRLILPFPPSVNALYSGNHRRFKSKRYKAWIAEADMALSQQNRASISGPIEVLYRFASPDNRGRDVFNYEKAVSDFLVDSGIIEDDSHIQRGVVEWADDLTPGLVEITIKKAD